jgi:predicted  nucleic acid-binding Zn-ribbon protein
MAMTTEMAERVAKLPAWAREHIKHLEVQGEPAAEEIVRLRREIERLKAVVRRQEDRINAMHEMFQCAAKGGNEVAQAVQKIVEDWIVFGIPEEPA